LSLELLAEHFPVAMPTSETGSAPLSAETLQVLRDLRPYVREQELPPESLLQQLQVQGAPSGSDLARLLTCLDNFDYPAALTLLDTLLAP
jgi:hypothetical protein